MKKLIYIITIIVLGCLTACSTDDEKPLIVQTEDFSAEVRISAIKGDTIGIVSGTSTRGTVNYTINSQTPSGIFTIGATYGELIVDSGAVSDLVIGSKVLLEVGVSKEGITEISNVEITVIPPPVDVSPWVGTLIVFQDGVSSIEVPSSDITDGRIELSGGNPFDLYCPSFENSIIISLGALTTATTGPASIEKQSLPCFTGSSETIEATGTYDTETKEIVLNYTYADGGYTETGTKIITPKGE